MDAPDVDAATLADSLRFIRRVNTLLGYTRATISHVERFSRSWKRAERVTFIDLATGSADVPLAIVAWARRRGFDVRVVGLDLHETTCNLARAATRHEPAIQIVRGDALDPPFAPGSFERVHAGHFYGHLVPEQRATFLAAAARLAGELVITDSALRPDGEPEAWQERRLNDGSRHRVYKRWFTAAGLAEELGGGEIVHDGPWFVAVRLAHA